MCFDRRKNHMILWYCVRAFLLYTQCIYHFSNVQCMEPYILGKHVATFHLRGEKKSEKILGASISRVKVKHITIRSKGRNSVMSIWCNEKFYFIYLFLSVARDCYIFHFLSLFLNLFLSLYVNDWKNSCLCLWCRNKKLFLFDEILKKPKQQNNQQQKKNNFSFRISL